MQSTTKFRRERIVEYDNRKLQALTCKYMVNVFEISGRTEYPHAGVQECIGYEALFLFDSDYQAQDFIEYLESETASIRDIYKELEEDKYHTFCDVVRRRYPL